MPVSQHYGPLAAAGGGAGFSADCIAALQACGFNPDHFGSYEEVCKKIEAAKEKVAKWNKAVADGRAATGTPPSRDDYFLAGCQSGHIRQNATAVTSGGRGGSLCNNVMDGYNGLDAGCLPQSGRASGNGTHGQASWLETTQAAGRGSTGDKYRVADRRADEAARVRSTVNRQMHGMNEAEQRAAQARQLQAQAKAAKGSGAAAGTAGGSASGAQAGSTAPKKKNPSAAERDMAAECISAFQQFKEAEMKAKCKADAAGSPNKSTPKGYKAELAKRRADASQAWKRASAARQNVRAKEKSLANAQKSGDPARIARAQANLRLARVQSGNAASEARRASERVAQYSPESQACWMAQGRRLNNGTQRSAGRVPARGGSSSPPAPYNTPGAAPTIGF